VTLKVEDPTLPHIIVGNNNSELFGGVVVTNNATQSASDLVITATVNGRSIDSPVPDILAGTFRKTRFNIDAGGVSEKGDVECRVQLKQKGKVLDEKTLTLTALNATDHHSYTFESNIDGSVQYYSVAPPTLKLESPALFLSVHGAGVEAIGQARAYAPKDWGVLVAPTNRRPRGFNWEDWGRLDALEVFERAKKQFNPDPEKIYLTGHSMGGHGTWFLGATYPDKWAAIAPCAGYPTLSAYGSADGRIPDSARTENEKTLLRASHGSDVIALAGNYRNHGVYIFHGDADRVVPVTFARQMRDVLADFHPDFSYYEYPGGSHWFGNESVDWPPLFNFFRWHTLKHDSAVNVVDFTTANPGVSATFRWATIVQQSEPLEYSKIHLIRDTKEQTITGITVNVRMLRLELDGFAPGQTVDLSIDSMELAHRVAESKEEVYLLRDKEWKVVNAVSAKNKNPNRYGTFKDAFNHKMVFVYATGGNNAEDRWAFNKARFDAEMWYYRGNGAVEIVPDTQFNPAKYADRGVILYGNASTNKVWNTLLADCPIQVTRERITVGAQTFEGNDLAAYFVWPRKDSDIASIAVVTGTGLPGLNATEPNQYFAGGSGFPDYVIFSREMLRSGAEGVKAAGFFTNEWTLGRQGGD
ncbi:MAG TPA: prolyl oligopeptidase family serine peptidase, partial [Chryseosolibacter sp.]|nr:prolyl oligopeptidase family serine peptidase [Chryseosolibacter sp.]